MFQVTKNARIHKSVASESFSTAEVSAMTKEAGSNYFVWPFKVDVIGCGSEAPAEYSPDARWRFTHAEGYGIADLGRDIDELANKHGVKLIVNAVNRGVDLELRGKARPNPKAKMSDADKVLWVISNLPAEVQPGMTPKQFLEAFEIANG